MSSFVPTSAEPPIISYPIKANGIMTRVLECGTGDRVVLLLHGSGARADRWRRNLSGLAARGYRGFAIDFPGHGFASKRTEYGFDTPSFAEMVADFVSSLDAGPISLIGTSLGAHVAAWYACSAPSSVRAAVLVGALGLVPVHRDSEQTSSRIADTSADGVERKLRMLLFDQSLLTTGWVEEERRVNTSPGATEALAQLRSYLDTRVNEDIVGAKYAALSIPTLLVWGADDRWVVPRYGLEASRLLPRSPLVILKNAGHMPYFERADTFNSIADEFLSNSAGFPSGVQDR
jgi:pimeloyl-ACP methyl ester carboxylesterase